MDKYSFLNAAHTSFFAEQYEKYLTNPDNVEPSWRAFFQGFDFGLEGSLEDLGIESDKGGMVVLSNGRKVEMPEALQKEFQVIRLIDGYRSRGHLFTETNPVRERRKYVPTLDIDNFGLSQEDLDTVFDAGKILGIGPASLKEIIRHLESIYCDAIGVEYMYIRTPERIQWIQDWLNKNDNHPNYTADEKKNILRKLNEAVSFENFLHTKYVGQKRFSLEGGESLIPALDVIIEKAADKGVKQFVVGMAHRGRLNVLTNIFGKSPKDTFSEFDGKDYEETIFDGDVKYHLGWTSKRETDSGKMVNINIAPNPSHLETVGAVVEGITRGKQDRHYEGKASDVLPIIVHGDAAISGQGIVYEIVQMAQLDGYKTGGTIHIVVNNQIGFTTNYLDGRSSTYCTDVAKATLCPVFHVNGDDIEAVVQTVLIAFQYRQEFGRDVFIDLLCYRKYGHNEGDEPKFTQPKLYDIIANHPNPREIYLKQIIEEGIIKQDEADKIIERFGNTLEKNLNESKEMETLGVMQFLKSTWESLSPAVAEDFDQSPETGYKKEDLIRLAKNFNTLPEDKNFFRKLKKLMNERLKMV